MKRFSLITLIFLISLAAIAQNERKVIRQGVKAYEEGDYNDAEVQFRKANDINHESFEAEYNTGAALYGQEKYDETYKQYEPLVQRSSDPDALAKIWHNMGNSLLESQKYEPSIEAYKNSLRLNPTDYDTKYNLAYAKKKLQEQQMNQDQEQQNGDQQGEDQQNQEQQDQDQQNQEQQNEEQQGQDQQNEGQQEQEPKEQQGRPQEISKEDAERMLNAIQMQEKDVKNKVDKKKAAVAKVKTEKDW